MPRGTRHIETGTLGWDASNRLHVLHIPGGGHWYLAMPGRTARLIGHEVTVEGIRLGFNMLDVSRVLAVDGVTRRPGWGAMLARLLGAAI
ncbi:MAG: hypothetical protein K2P68_12650 [Sphingomonas sp.]|nr:hypothetical protein [Sphingomonas sp.]